MTPLDTLLSRKSHNKLTEPAPTASQIELMLQAALRAPDHAQLKPWKYRIFQAGSLLTLADLFTQASQLESPAISQEKLNKIRLKTFRAPMIMVATVNLKDHPKVPEIEQILSAGASVQNLIMAAHFLDIGAIWRTGALCFNHHLNELLNLKEKESIIGFIYLGKEQGEKKPVPIVEQSAFVEWC